MMAYAPKCLEYRHEGYRARMQLACMDHNAHCNRPQLTRKDGTLVFCRKWSKKCGQWSAIAVPSRKTYDYVPGMVISIMFNALKPHVQLHSCYILEIITSGMPQNQYPSIYYIYFFI